MGLFKSDKVAKSPEAKYAQERLSKGHTVLIQRVEFGTFNFRFPEKLVEETEAGAGGSNSSAPSPTRTRRCFSSCSVLPGASLPVRRSPSRSRCTAARICERGFRRRGRSDHEPLLPCLSTPHRSTTAA